MPFSLSELASGVFQRHFGLSVAYFGAFWPYSGLFWAFGGQNWWPDSGLLARFWPILGLLRTNLGALDLSDGARGVFQGHFGLIPWILAYFGAFWPDSGLFRVF